MFVYSLYINCTLMGVPMNKKHQIIWTVLRPLVGVFLRIKFGYTYEMAHKKYKLPDNYIVLSNHATDYDPLLVGVSFKRQMYFVASEHISRWKRAYPLIKFALEPIIRKKGMSAAHAIIDIMRRLRHGSNVGMFAEGVRTWDGVTGPIASTTGQMVKRAGCGLVTYKLVGGYFLSPGWSDGTRYGESHGSVVGVYTAEQLAKMSVDEINEVIARDLYEDAYERQLASPKRYRGKRLAEHIENLIFICPECGAMESIRSKGNTAACEKCGMKLTFDEYGMIKGGRFKTVLELSDWQKGEIVAAAERGEKYVMESAVLCRVADGAAEAVYNGKAVLSSEGLLVGDRNFGIDEIDDMAFHGRRTVVFSSGKEYFELCPADCINAVKFPMMFKYLKKNSAAKASHAERSCAQA